MARTAAPDSGAVVDGVEVKRLREKRGWSQMELAVKAGLNYSTITKIEQGVATDIRISTVSSIAAALDCTTDSLLTRER